MNVETAEFWRECALVAVDDEIVHGAPVFAGTRLPVETVIGSVDAYMELRGMSENETVLATFRDFPTAPGPEAIREVLTYFEAHKLQLQA